VRSQKKKRSAKTAQNHRAKERQKGKSPGKKNAQTFKCELQPHRPQIVSTLRRLCGVNGMRMAARCGRGACSEGKTVETEIAGGGGGKRRSA